MACACNITVACNDSAFTASRSSLPPSMPTTITSLRLAAFQCCDSSQCNRTITTNHPLTSGWACRILSIIRLPSINVPLASCFATLTISGNWSITWWKDFERVTQLLSARLQVSSAYFLSLPFSRQMRWQLPSQPGSYYG